MIVSFLIPTRQRLQALLDGIKSIKETASPDVQLEFLIRVDEDDSETLAGRDCIPGKVIVGPRYCGYRSNHVFVNELAANSHGDWLVIWNDDAFMRCQDWDKLLPPTDRAQVLWLRVPGTIEFGFPIMTRKLYELWGCFAPGMPADTFIYNICKMADVPIPDIPQSSNILLVEHIRNEVNIHMLESWSGERVNPPGTYLNKKTNEELAKLLHDAYYE